jgi:Cu/Ag efflux protein CusF
MRHTISISLLLAATSFSGIAPAAEHGNGMNHSEMSVGHEMSANVHMGAGVVNRIDMKNAKVNLTHGPIKSLGWSGMTMDFMVKDTAILKHLKPGQKVKFEVVKEGTGKYYVTKITPAK